MKHKKIVVLVLLILVILISIFSLSTFGKKEISNPPMRITVKECLDGVIMDIPGGQQCLLSDTLSSFGWKTYINTKYRYEIKYPGTYSIIETYNPDDLLLRSTSDYQKDTDLTFAGVSVDTNTPVTQCKDYPKQPIEDDAMGGERGKNYSHSIIRNGLCYTIRYLHVYRDLRDFKDPPYPPHYDEIKVLTDLEEMVASFKFIDTKFIVVPVSTTTDAISQ
jgi:hypothetical protein